MNSPDKVGLQVRGEALDRHLAQLRLWRVNHDVIVAHLVVHIIVLVLVLVVVWIVLRRVLLHLLPVVVPSDHTPIVLVVVLIVVVVVWGHSGNFGRSVRENL